MKAHELIEMGVEGAEPIARAFELVRRLSKDGVRIEEIAATIREIALAPEMHAGDLAMAIVKARSVLAKRDEPAPWRQWGDDIEPQAIEQMERSCSLPVAVRGALMPDAHLGYGLPVGGVLATRDVVIPYAVGVDIACRMKMSVLDVPVDTLDDSNDRSWLEGALVSGTRFGVGADFDASSRRRHDVLDCAAWEATGLVRGLKDKAWAQLGTSGSGNHFVEFGELEVERSDVGVEPGRYLALLSHSGSCGTGAKIAGYYSKLAKEAHPELPADTRDLAWLGLDTEPGRDYWLAMELMGRYAAANHDCIHRRIADELGAEVIFGVENHHNFAWVEEHYGENVVVHRKGATPAGKGMLGIIPGSMSTPAYLVRGKGELESLRSAAHGAGRRMSRTAALRKFGWPEVNALLSASRVRLISAGIDEAPMVYKDIERVMGAQSDLVETLARFHPRIVKMSPSGEKAED